MRILSSLPQTSGFINSPRQKPWFENKKSTNQQLTPLMMNIDKIPCLVTLRRENAFLSK